MSSKGCQRVSKLKPDWCQSSPPKKMGNFWKITRWQYLIQKNKEIKVSPSCQLGLIYQIYISLIFVPIFLCLEHQLWKITNDRKLVNKSVGTDWIFGSNDWLIADGFVFNQQTEKVLDISGGASTGYLMTKRFSY